MGNGVKVGLKVLLYYLMLVLLSLLFLSTMNGVFQYILNAMLLVGFAALVYNDGGYQGEKAATVSAMIEKQTKEGHSIDPTIKAQAFRKSSALAILLVSALPLLALSSANLACEKYYPEVVVSQEEVDEAQEAAESTAEGEEEMRYDEDAFPEADIDIEQEETAPITTLMVITRAVFLPFVSLYSILSAHWLYVSFIPLSFLLPLIAVAGFLRGPKFRQKKLEDIEKGKKRKMRNLRVNKKPRQPKAMKPEV